MIKNFVDKVRRMDSPERKEVSNYLMDRMASYFESDDRRLLENRYRGLDATINLKYGGKEANRTRYANEWLSKITVPLAREQYLAQRAVLKANFRAPDLITISPSGQTPKENAEMMQKTLNSNLKTTKFRANTLNIVFNYVSRAGAVLVVPEYRESFKKYKKTQYNGISYQQEEIEKSSFNIWNRVINPLNYFRTPGIPGYEETDFQGYLDSVPLSDLITRLKLELYIKEALAAVIKKGKEYGSKDARMAKIKSSDNRRITVDTAKIYTYCHIKGNEGDLNKYYIEMVDGEIIRIEENPHEEEIEPPTPMRIDPHLHYWWGNTSVEGVIPFENAMRIILSKTVDEGMKALERFIFYDKSTGIDPALINEMRQNGGFVPFDGKDGMDARKAFTEFQGRDINVGSTQALMAELKEGAQRLKPKADLSRKAQQGGIQNATATAAAYLEEEGDIQNMDYLESFAFDLMDLGRKNCVMLQQFLPDAFIVRGDDRQPAMQLYKRQILGEYEYNYATSLTKNKQMAQNNLLNLMTFIQNMRGTGDPSWMRIDMPLLIKDWFKKVDIDIDADKIYPDLPSMQQAPANMAGIPQAAANGAQPEPQANAMEMVA